MPTPKTRTKLDQLLAERGYAPSRSRARDMIRRGCVKIDGMPARKASQLVSAGVEVEVNDPAAGYVSRAALKLVAGLDVANFYVAGKHALDLGASTGGFTQVLLERGAASVVSVDVGHGQMDGGIEEDPRVTHLEGLNARELTQDHLPKPPDIIVSDMSFISLKLAAEPALQLAADSATAVLLVKPQFEVGKDGIGKGGLVKDKDLVANMLKQIETWFCALPGWEMTYLVPSPIEGGDGNKEYLLCGVRNA